MKKSEYNKNKVDIVNDGSLLKWMKWCKRLKGLLDGYQKKMTDAEKGGRS